MFKLTIYTCKLYPVLHSSSAQALSAAGRRRGNRLTCSAGTAQCFVRWLCFFSAGVCEAASPVPTPETARRAGAPDGRAPSGGPSRPSPSASRAPRQSRVLCGAGRRGCEEEREREKAGRQAQAGKQQFRRSIRQTSIGRQTSMRAGRQAQWGGAEQHSPRAQQQVCGQRLCLDPGMSRVPR